MLFLSCALAQGSDIHVDAANATPPHDGTVADPYQSITQAINSGLSSGDVIHVASGDYTAALENFPLVFPSGVTIEGASSNPASYPRLGGDLIAEGEITGNEANALIHVNCSSADGSGIAIRKLRFRAESASGVNAPIAVLVEVRNQHELSGFEFAQNWCERPSQNGASARRATISVVVENASISESSIHGNKVDVSDLGGLHVLASVEDGEATRVELEVVDNLITNTGGVGAEFGFRWEGQDAGADAPEMYGIDQFNGNVIRSLSSGIGNGVEFLCGERSGGFDHMDSFAVNIVEGCSGDGVVFSCDGWGDPTKPEIAHFGFQRNRIRGNGGSGLVFQWDVDGNDGGDGYMHLNAGALNGSNLIVENAGFGIEFRGVGADSRGSFQLQNATIAHNGQEAEGFENDIIPGSSNAVTHVNCIVWGNDPDDVDRSQVAGLGSANLASLMSNVSHSDWEGISGGTGNLNVDPKFVDVDAHDFHLEDDPLSPCVDAGDNAHATGDFDFERDDRKLDGDCTGNPAVVVDMGCDELDGECP